MQDFAQSSLIFKRNFRELGHCVRLTTAFACIFWFWILLPRAFASSTVLLNLDPETQVTSAGQELKFLTGYSFEQADEVIRIADEKWLPSTQTLNFGYSQRKVWLKFYSRLENSSQFPLVLEFPYPHFDMVKVGFRAVDGSVHFSDAKKEIPLLGMRLPYVNFVSALPASSEKITEHFVYLENDGPLPVPIELKSARELLKSAFKYLAIYVFTIGIMFVMIIYNFFVYIFIKDVNYFLYSIYISVALATCIWLNGLFFNLGSGQIVQTSFKFLPCLCVAFSSLFSKRFLEIYRYNSFLNKLHNMLIVFAMISVGIQIFPMTRAGNLFMYFTIALSSFISLATGVILIKKTPFALHLLISYSALFLGVGIFSLREFGILPHTFWTFHAINLGSVMEAILFSLSLAYRMRLQERQKVMHEEKIRISEAKFDSLKKTIQMISHDIRRPFSIFESVIAVLETKDTAAETKEHLVEVKQSLSTINSTVTDILDALNDRALDLSEIDIRNEIHECTKMVIASFHLNHSITFKPSFDHKYKSLTDRKKLSRILTNIITNACEAVKLDGTIWFSTKEILEHGSHFTHVTIGNFGSFIAESEREQIFELFYTKDKPKGTGLGLSIAKKYVEELGGRIWCTSSHESGVEFHFLLPSSDIHIDLCQEPFPKSSCEVKLFNEVQHLESVRHPHSKRVSAGIPEKIIILDDSRPILAAWSAKLKGVSVLTFQSPENFFEAQLLDPSMTEGNALIISDYHFDKMSQMNGVDLARKIAPLPVILCSSLEMGRDELIKIENIMGSIPKRPLALDELMQHVEKLEKLQ